MKSAEEKMSVGDRIGQIRKDRKMSQEEFAYKIGVVRQTVYKWEANITKPGSEQLATIAELFDVSADYILFGKEEKAEIAAESIIVTDTDLKNKNRKRKLIICSVLIGATVIFMLIMVFAIIIVRGKNTGDEATALGMLNFTELIIVGIILAVAGFISLSAIITLSVKKKTKGAKNDKIEKSE